ncbi:hypothetical protein LCI18_002812 [Fusarium solani-melongenae]|uniref:Uncharacterized protein n=1 Tax=Fusarium solani subsp. cucurbitae TaxID=2747967 RepID=A0ACD3YSA7_FUSSC|nr:hypothetical protein LCI18_002812 [Fusarium solani-melongenae]
MSASHGSFLTRPSIVAVHGLNPRSKPGQEHAWDTWRTSSGPEGKLWLRDELPKELPHTRIFLYEYNSTAVYGKDRTTFIDKVNAFLEAMRIDRRKVPRRPLLLLGHSLGGLLIKQALINTHNNEKYQDIKLATQGLEFFATPHDGGKQSLFNIGQIAAKIALNLGFQKDDNILETLKNGSMFSDLMHEHWKQRLLEYPTVSFWGTLDNIVPRESTPFSMPGKHENVVSLQASHGGVCKFGTSLQDRDNFKLVQANIQDLYDKLLRSLYKSLYSDPKDRNPQRVKGTCEWFTSHDRFQDWKDGETCGLLWVSADPGCGKSVLSRYLVDEVLQGSSLSTTCYFFFKDEFEDQKSVSGALCCLLRQIFREKPALLQDPILKQYDEDGDKLLESFRKLWGILVSVSTYHDSGQIICILDALDECEEQDRRLVVETINNFYLEKGTNMNLKFLVASRPYVNIERGSHDIQTKLPVIHLRGEGHSESEKIAREIDIVVEARITRLCMKLQLAEPEEKVVRREMRRIPNRTYLWIYLVFEAIESSVSHSSTQIKEHIRNIPATVEDAYEKILSRSPDKNKARKLLHMVLAAKRPLRLKEMAVAMTIERNHTSYSQLDIGPRDKLTAWVRDLCGLFVSILGDKIYLLHQTATEFLVGKVKDGESRKNPVEESNARSEWKEHVGVNHRATPKSLKSLKPLDQKHPLLSYSVEHWSAHLRDESSAKGLQLSDMLQLCSGSESACLAQVPTPWTSRGASRPTSLWSGRWITRRDSGYYLRAKDLTALLTASILGLDAVTRHLLKLESTDANQRDPIFESSPLSGAVRSGQKAVFDTFIEAEAHYQKSQKTVYRLKCHFRGLLQNVPDKLEDLTTPLEWAVFCGEAHMVEKLLATRRVTVTNEMLFKAALDGLEDIMSALLATGQVTVDCRDYLKQTPLSYAAERGHEGVVQQLFATGKANINSIDEWGRTPLHYAAMNSHEEVIQQLLAMGKANVNSTNEWGQTPLYYAAREGCEGVVQQLLAESSIDVDTKDSEGNTVLALAARHGMERVVRKLLATARVDVNAIDRNGQTILSKTIRGRTMVSLKLCLKLVVLLSSLAAGTPSVCILEGTRLIRLRRS